MLPKLYRNDINDRVRQISTLKIFNDNVIELVSGKEYEIRFQAGISELCFRILLSQEFPREKPKFYITPVVSHAWVNPKDGEIVSAPGLLNFSVHSDLGRVVQAVIREFERNPPPSIQTTTTTSDFDGISKLNNFMNGGALNNIKDHENYQSLTFPNLNSLSLKDLEFLNENTDKQQEIINSTKLIKEQNDFSNQLIEKVEELADSNLRKKIQVDEIKAEIEKRIDVSTKLVFTTEELHGKYQILCERYSPNNIKTQMRSSAVSAEIQSEQIAEDFLHGKLEVENFLLLYTRTRMLCQMRKTKEEQFSHQLERLEKAGF